MDRATLKAFVTQAGEYILALAQQQNGDNLKTKNALADPNGPWRHGPVYVGVTNRATNLILFHGAFPDRFELRQAGISRDIATGELIFDQLIAAAESSPEGGFWEYYFDNPADDHDSVEVPKVGFRPYIHRFLPEKKGRQPKFPISFVINSGFYLSPGGTEALRGGAGEYRGPTRFRVVSVRCGAGCATRKWWRSRSRPRRGRSSRTWRRMAWSGWIRWISVGTRIMGLCCCSTGIGWALGNTWSPPWSMGWNWAGRRCG